MPSGGDWDELIGEAEAERFVGREQELVSFRQQVGFTKPRYLIFYITGQGGAGKTTLLNRYQEIARGFGFLSAECDELQRDVPAVLGRFTRQLAEQGFPLKHFDERYTTYRQRMHEIENDPEAPQGMAALLGRAVVRSAFIVGDIVPGLRKGLDLLPQESLETQASEWAAYLAKKLTNKDEVALVRDPVSILTPLFFEDLNKVAQTHKVLLCFDNFEAARPELREWLLRLREYKPSLNIRLAIAGRDQPGAKWDPLRSVTQMIRIDVFTEREAEAFLDVYAITDTNRRKEILELSGRLPVLMSWLAAVEGGEAETSLPTHDIVERFLRWVTEPALRQVALVAAIPRTLNADVLQLLLEQRGQAVDEQAAFDWLQTMPFVKQGPEGWYYHDVVRRMMLHYQRQKSPQMYRQRHAALANFFNLKRQEVSSSEEEQWRNGEWRKYTLAYVYHFLAADPNKHWREVLSLFVVAVRKHGSFALEMIEMLNADDIHDELTSEQSDMARLFRQQVPALLDGNLQESAEMLDTLCKVAVLLPQAKGYALVYRGQWYSKQRKWDKALADFDEALLYLPEEAWAIAQRGWTYHSMGRYQEALADFDRVVVLDKKDAGHITRRGVTYMIMGRYQEALADFDQALALDEKNAWAIAARGQTYHFLGRYQEALTDLNRAITLDEQYAKAINMRGITYRLLGRYQEALTDFDRAITIDPNNIRFIAQRGITYRLLRRYQEALTDFNQAITIDNTQARIFADRGETYFQMGRYQEALADYSRTIALDEKDDWHRYCRARVHLLAGQMSAFESDLHAAIELAQTTLRNIPDNWRIGFNLAFYNLVAGNVIDTESQYAKLVATCSSLLALQGAIEDLTNFLTMQPSNELATSILPQLRTRIAELKRSPSRNP